MGGTLEDKQLYLVLFSIRSAAYLEGRMGVQDRRQGGVVTRGWRFSTKQKAGSRLKVKASQGG